METLKLFVFGFFILSAAGWLLESLQESIVRKQIVSKGFFFGPWVPVQGIGGIAVVLAAVPVKEHPLIVFFAGIAVCTLAEYLTALFLEKCFKVKCWDYRTYPHTRWCHFQGRVCLTISLFFGLITLFVVYVFWAVITALALKLGPALVFVDITLTALFLCDAVISCIRTLRAAVNGKKLSGWAVFSGAE